MINDKIIIIAMFTKYLLQNKFIYDLLVKIYYIYIIWGCEKIFGQNGVANQKSLRNPGIELSYLELKNCFKSPKQP